MAANGLLAAAEQRIDTSVHRRAFLCRFTNARLIPPLSFFYAFPKLVPACFFCMNSALQALRAGC